MRNAFAPLFAAALLASAAFGDDPAPRTLTVPGDFADLDAALLAAQPGDRIVLAGGVREDVVLSAAGVTLEGRGAVLAGSVRVTGAGATLRGFRMRLADVHVEAADVTVRDNRPDGGSSWTVDVLESAERAVVEANRMIGGKVEALAPDAAIRKNRIASGSIVAMQRSTIEENSGPRLDIRTNATAAVRRNRCLQVVLLGDGCVVEDNVLRSVRTFGGLMGASLNIAGDDAAVRRNTLRLCGNGIFVEGSRAEITDNSVELGTPGGRRLVPDTAIELRSLTEGGTVERNKVTMWGGNGINTLTFQASISDNVIRGSKIAAALIIQGSSNSVVRNEIVMDKDDGTLGVGMLLFGDRNVAVDNHIAGPTHLGVFLDGIRNRLSFAVIEGVDGVGVSVRPTAFSPVVEGCTITGCDVGLVNAGSDTSLTDTQFHGNRRFDIVAERGFLVFEGNEFTTLSDDPEDAPH